MNKYIMKNKTKILTMLFATLIVLVSMFMLSGCSDTVSGDVNANIAPIVQFVNIPPEGQLFSRNPEVHWIGTDPDGLIDYYRYHIIDSVTVEAGGGLEMYKDSLTDDQWIQIDLNQTESDPHTTNTLPLLADTLDPVANPIAQYIFIQAFDLEGKGSLIASRLFSRNDNPPETFIFDIGNDTPFVNSVFEGGIVTGARFKWWGEDRKDYDDIGLTPPPFDYEWKIFGPFTKDTIDIINNTLVEDVFVTADAIILHLGDTLWTCETIQVDTVIGGDSTTIPVENCTGVEFDATFFSDSGSTPFYTKSRILNIDTTLVTDKFIVASFNGIDEWVQNESDTIYNLYRNFPSDTTLEMNFIFWTRSRDDALVKDLTPEFVTFPIINPKYERDIAVLDFTPSNGIQYANVDSSKAFWYNIIHNWADSTGRTIIFDTSEFAPGVGLSKTGIDYVNPGRYGVGQIPLSILLKHKVLILNSESYRSSGFTSTNRILYPEILSAMDAGINAWAVWRNPLSSVFSKDYQDRLEVPTTYTRYLGVDLMTYTGWWANGLFEGIRNEDFIGTYSIDESQWPNLDIDTTLLHTRLKWGLTNFLPEWNDSLAALPEVNWAARSFGTEVMYLYKSKYGNNNPFRFQFEGSPVGHKFQSNLFRSVHFNFTLLTMNAQQAQEISNNVLDWLYNPALSGTVMREDRYDDAVFKISIEEARQNYGERLIEQAELRKEQSSN